MALTKQDFYDEVLLSLGGGLVDVELEESDIEMCFKKAVRTFKQKGHNSYRNVFLKLDITDAVDGVFQLPPMLDTIVHVLANTNGTGLASGGDDVFNQIVYNTVFGTGGTGSCRGCGGIGDMLTYEMQSQQAEMMKRRATGGGIAFHHDEFRNTLKILTKYRGKSVVLDAYYNLEDIEYMRNDWIVRWTIAEAKQVLGMAYRKFSGVASPTGETQLSGSEYISESKEEKRELLEDIENYVDGSMDYGQIIIG